MYEQYKGEVVDNKKEKMDRTDDDSNEREGDNDDRDRPSDEDSKGKTEGKKEGKILKIKQKGEKENVLKTIKLKLK